LFVASAGGGWGAFTYFRKRDQLTRERTQQFRKAQIEEQRNEIEREGEKTATNSEVKRHEGSNQKSTVGIGAWHLSRLGKPY
jgi:hypothetical protein